jgi:hypothetical protein
MSNRPLNYTTTIPVHQTVTECQSILASAGASSVAVHFEDGQPSGLSFTLKTPHGVRSFTLPVNIDGMRAVLIREAKPGGSIHALHVSRAQMDKLTSAEHAAEVAWRVVKDWLEANLALIAAQMATLTEVMLPYLIVGDDDRTLWQAYREREQAAIEAGGPDA